MEPLLSEDAVAQARAVRTGHCRPAELVEAAIAAAEARNPSIGAIIHERYERAVAEAAAVDPEAPFAAVPIVVKDSGCAMAGEPLCNGLRVARDARWRAVEDDTVTDRLRSAGFVVIGRTNVPELCTAPTTEPAAFGPTRNPWNPAFTVGGSSGGSAAAVAAGIVPLAHGTDGGGSIRVPASLCGLIGLKPTRGRIPAGPGAGERWAGHSTDGFLTRSVRDTAAVLDAVAGPSPGDPYAAPPLASTLADAARRGPERLRIGVRLTAFGSERPADPACREAAELVARTLADLGHQVVDGGPAALDELEAVQHRGVVVAAALAAEVQQWAQRLGRPVEPEDLEPWNEDLVRMGRATTAVDFLASQRWLHRWSRRVATWWSQGADLLVTPTLCAPAFELGSLPAHLDARSGTELREQLGWLTPPWNSTGQPAVSIPAGRDANGVPLGVQLVAASGREDLLVAIAAELEARWGPVPVAGP